MHDDLTRFLADREPIAVEDVDWGSQMRLRMTAYLTDATPPLRYVTSARAIVMHGDQVLVVEDQDGTRHVIPGGRLEASELPEAALHREIAEETGWQVEGVRQLGLLHFRHLTPKPPDYRYPYPSFIQVIYRAEAIRHDPGRVIDDDYVVGAELVPAPMVRTIALSPVQRCLIDAVIGGRSTDRQGPDRPQ